MSDPIGPAANLTQGRGRSP